MPLLRKVVLYLVSLYPAASYAQADLLPNEVSVLSFTVQSGKQVIIARDKANGYLIYRFGNRDKMAFEFPAKNKESWGRFNYSFYLRGGGVANEGMDLNYLYFFNDHYEYVVYDTYYARGNKQRIGIKVIDTVSKKTTDIPGIYRTRNGSLIDFRDNDLVGKGDELFD